MIEKAEYYINLVITLCGFDGSDDSVYFGWTIVLIAAGLVVYAFYEGITKTIWPGEKDTQHIKYQILNDDVEVPDYRGDKA